MKCPHCFNAIHVEWSEDLVNQEPQRPGQTGGDVWYCRSYICPACGNFVANLQQRPAGSAQVNILTRVWPQGGARPVPPEVEARYAGDFREAAAVLPLSPKASAALSRRVLQDVLHEKAGVTHADLHKEIQEVLDSGKLPSHLADNLDAVRTLGNFAAHPIKSTSTGTVVDVEDGEAEWLLDVLEGLFDHYFVTPAKQAAKRAALDAKLQDAGKPPLRTS